MWSFPSESSGTNACTLFSYPMASLAIRKNTGIWHGIGELVDVQHDKIVSRRKAHRSECIAHLPNPHNLSVRHFKLIPTCFYLLLSPFLAPTGHRALLYPEPQHPPTKSSRGQMQAG